MQACLVCLSVLVRVLLKQNIHDGNRSGSDALQRAVDLLGPQNRPYRPTTTATATTAITGSARVASVGFHGVYELAVYANMDPIRSAYAKVPSRRAR